MTASRRPFGLALAAAFAAGSIFATSVAPAGPVPAPTAFAAETGKTPGLRGTLPVPALWAAWKARFVASEGRVIDDANGGVSHSEGQGYGMLLAVAADDRETFRTLWNWTRAHLSLRKDGLAAWRWRADRKPHVDDPNNASDGDILIAWALMEAGEAWNDAAATAAARRIARAVFAANVVPTRFGPTLLPGATGFGAGARKDGPVVNPSYWVFPALARLAEVTPDLDWRGVAASGEKLLAEARFGPANLPAEWVSIAGAVRPADGFPATFGYNAVRVPLHLAWGESGRRERLAPFMARWSGEAEPRATMAVVDLASGRDAEPLIDPGYRAVAAVVACALEGRRFPDDLRGADTDHYYPTTLRALAMVAVNQRYPTCW
ncbi:glycosyl hydrolase family 8 [Pinisolibacter sp.]|uniref:glycosyl hydrolase family 8 n=1 Tax=Pinisolibacter sp. TaxID=2172024 RepID=UPI002FDD2EB5